ncbi:MAG TPA: hypothetical protein PLB91_01520, partial [Spirochaetales bacterium]|nr:hypothetical protein [Spirochaetales bacterium]
MENVKRKDRPGPHARLARAAALACAALVALLAGCAQGSGDPGEPRVVVYAAGSYSEGGWDLPCYWRDGTRVPLPFDAEDQAGRVAAIAVDGGTVYTAGSTGYHDYYSCYWKGTERSDLAGRGAEAIAVSGGTVYTIVNGDWSGGGITAFGGAYYAGAALNHLAGIANTDPSRPVWDTSAYGMAVAGGIVYTAGRASGSDEGYACYWTGADARTDLDAASEAKAIYVSGGTVYTAGWTVDGKVCVPCYWAGAAMTKLPIVADNEGYAEDIEVVDGSVYTAGYYGYYDAD